MEGYYCDIGTVSNVNAMSQRLFLEMTHSRNVVNVVDAMIVAVPCVYSLLGQSIDEMRLRYIYIRFDRRNY